MPPMMPQKPRRHGSPWAPLAGQFGQMLGLGAFRQAPQGRQRSRQGKVTSRENIWAIKAEKQMHLSRPGAEAWNGGNGRNRRPIRQIREPIRRKPAIRKCLGQRAGMAKFRARKPGPAQCLVT